jgi:hypothetical protein
VELERRSGRWRLRWREGGRRQSRTFDRKSDANDYAAWLRRRQQLGHAAVPDDVKLAEFVESYWRLHAVPNLSQATRDLYGRIWEKHILPALGDYGVRELSPKRLTRFRAELEQGGVGTATVVKALTIVQSILSFAVNEEIVEFNAAAAVRKPRYTRAREPHIFLPPAVEQIRRQLDIRDRTLVSVLAYSGPRSRGSGLPPGMGRHRRADDPLRRYQAPSHPLHPAPPPLARDLREWFLASGRPAATQRVFPAHDGAFWHQDDWRNWRKRVWLGEPDRRRSDRPRPTPPRTGCAPTGTRPRDLPSSYVTLRVYEGIPLTQIAREVGTSVRMIEEHYAGVIASWDGKRVPAERQIRAARRTNGLTVDSNPKATGARP